MSARSTDVLEVSRDTLIDVFYALSKRCEKLRASHLEGPGGISYVDHPEYVATSLAYSNVSSAIEALNLAITATRYLPSDMSAQAPATI